MSKSDVIALFYQNTENLTPMRILLVLVCATVAAALIYIVYRLTARFGGDGYSESFNQGNVLMTLLTAVIMMLISTNIAVSLGMVGALSIVRFRTAIKNPRDTIFLFWSIVLGLCVGTQYYVLAAIADCFIALVVLGLHTLRTHGKECYTLLVRCSPQEVTVQAVDQLLDSCKCSAHLLALNQCDQMTELVYALSGARQNCTLAAQQLAERQGVTAANLVGSAQTY